MIVFPFPAIKDNEYNEYIDVYKVVEFNEVRSGRWEVTAEHQKDEVNTNTISHDNQYGKK